MYTETLMDAQRDFERNHAERGALRYQIAQDKKASFEGFDRRADVQAMIRGALPILAEALQAWIDDASAKKGRPAAALAPLKELDVDVVALNALSTTFRESVIGTPLVSVAENIGKSLQVELEAFMIHEKDPKAAKRYLAFAEGEASGRKTLKRHERLTEKLQAGLSWSRRTKVLVGGTVLNVVLVALGEIFVRGSVTDQRGVIPIVKLTDEAATQLAAMTETAAWMHPLLKPMIVPPRRWTQIDTGAYLELQLNKFVPMVRTWNRDHQKLLREAIKSGAMQPVLDALNGIQETRFAIDTRVLDIVKWTKEEGHRTAESFPLTQVPEKAPKMAAEAWEALSVEARIAMSRQRKTVRDITEASKVNGAVFAVDVDEARKLARLDAFFLPHSMDSRGRIYAVPHFNPQRSDHIKAMFHFADRVAMGRDGGYWLSIHLANCGDFGKVSKRPFKERVAWVDDNEEMILRIARDPRGAYAEWAAADSPFCFLQACFEYAEWVESGRSADFMGCIAIALDGSCSGLQHYSAMNRSEEEGFHVNLLSRPDVGDIYQVTADRARPALEALATGGDLVSITILGEGFGRSEVKRNVMTYFYGSGKFGMRDQHMEDTMRPLADKVALGDIEAHPYALLTKRTNKETGEETEALDGGFTCATAMAAHVHAAIVSVAPQADKAATWFQGLASILAHESLPVVWNTPMGLPVMQRYSEYTSKVVNMWLYDRKVMVPTSTDKVAADGKVLTRVEALIREAPTKRIDKKKARSAIAPNVVHSLDAAHLQRVVTLSLAEGITAFQLIHDSFATHAGNTGRFFQIIREAFVEQYDTYCPFEELEAYARSVLSPEGVEKLEALEKPARGTLDLRSILTADYAFA